MDLRENYKVALICTMFPTMLGFMMYWEILFPIWYCKIVLALYVVAILSLLIPKFGNYIYDKSVKIGNFVGKYIAIAALFFIYILAVIPTGLLMKIVKRDRLMLKKTETKTYWQVYDSTNTDYEYQF